MRNVKVFVSSPSDLRKARAVVADVVRALNERPTIRDRYKFSPYLYEEHAPALTGEGPQEVVNREMIQPHHADILVCMLWSRMGTPLSAMNPDTGKPYLSGTEYEFYEAYRSYQRRKTPTLLLYRCTAPPLPDADPQQMALVKEFFHRFEGPDAPLRGLYRTFNDEEQLRRALINDLDLQIVRWERPARRIMDQVIRPFWFLFVLMLVAIAAALIALPRLSTPSIAPIQNYGFNVAIAGFSALPGSDIAQADVHVLSEALYTSFVQRLDAVRNDLTVDVGVWSPAQVGAVAGATLEEREANAAALVQRLKEAHNARADIVVYGVVSESGSRVAVQPEFYVTDTWPELSELYGRFGLSSALYARNIDQSRALSGELSNRSQVLAFITQGLVQMITANYDSASRAFGTALSLNQDVVGRDVMFVLRGNSAIGNYNLIVSRGFSGSELREVRRLPELIAQAEADFRAALGENPDYARAYAGLGTAEYLLAMESSRVSRSFDLESGALDAIETTFQNALSAPDSPESADIDAKVAFGVGQVEVIRMLSGETEAAARARAQFEQVISLYDDGANLRIKELAAEATARLALIARYEGDYEGARAGYSQALELTGLEERALLIQRSLLEVTVEAARARGDIDAAAAAYEELLPLIVLPDELAYANFRYGKMLMETGRLDGALAVYDRAVFAEEEARVPFDFTEFPALGAALWVEAGNAFYDGGRLEDAITAYRAALALDPEGQTHLADVITETQAELDAQPPG
ncbi:MAG: tetratricopeptide repeat protein [Anaerolineae bacterium]|nr:tetratricopeptide repeat protein [Anaerolineae bacterium]NUQ02782.1 tetratricopeptide repeat protein [Anaerolineae bacterium]